jgi:hypothetical protein
LSATERAKVMALADDLPHAWNHPAATTDLQKRILRAVLVEIVVRVEPDHLLDRVFGHQPARLRQRLADHRCRKRCLRHHPKRGTRQRIDPLCRSGPYNSPRNDRP